MKTIRLSNEILIASLGLAALILSIPYVSGQQSTNVPTPSLGNPIYSESDIIIHTKQLSKERFVVTLEGNGTLSSENGRQISTASHAVVFAAIKLDGTVISNGRMTIRTQDGGFAMIIFHKKIDAGSDHVVGIGFVSDRASGELESLGGAILVFRGIMSSESNSGTLTFWRIDRQCIAAFECYPLE
jgi:hypothetical protein